ncbi:hypothetical protein N0V94_003958 [Neodidymelliopsis sp. IMI 364377]|nr:hypothetical protein N0V94_003958 [Neodidymelliopsis sp. IMI 364377]
MSTDESEAQPTQAIEDETTQEPLTKSGVADAGERAQRAKFKKGQMLHMAVIANGRRVKGDFRVHALVYNRGGWVDYQLIDELTGQLYRHGAGVREKDLKAQ